MILTITNTIEGKNIQQYLGVVTGEVIIGANIFKDFMASITDIIGGRSDAYERALRDAREAAMKEMQLEASKLGAHAVVGIDLDYETIGKNGGMLMVSVSGTAVKLS